MGTAADIFVSYKAEDRSRVKLLVNALEAEGFSVWWDADIGAGANWQEDIEQHLDSAKCVLVAWTKRSVGHDGHFVRDEARRAQRRDVYVPVCFDRVDPPLGFGEIQTLPLKGWKGNPADPRFRTVADVVRSYVTGERSAHPHVESGEPLLSRRAAIGGGIGIVSIAVAGAGGWLLLRPSPASSASIAVLPFANLSGDPAQAYFSDGIADEIRSALARIAGLTVIGSISSEAVRNEDAKTAARKLGVGAILTGSVRQSASTIRILAELIDGRTGADRWSQDYDRDPGDAIAIQTDIAENVASSLTGALGLAAARAAVALGGTDDSFAQKLILQSKDLGRQSSKAESYPRRLALANAAIARDSNYAEAYVEKALVLGNIATNFESTPAAVAERLAQAEAAARRAVAIAPKFGWAHAVLANVLSDQLDFGGTMSESRKAVNLSPADARVLASVATNLGLLASPDEGLQAADRAVALDGLNSTAYNRKCEMLVFARRYQEAIQAGRTALTMAPERTVPHIYVGDALLLLGEGPQAKVEYRAIGADTPFMLERLALLAARTGDRNEAARLIAELKRTIGATASYQYAEIKAQLGDKDGAFAELENAVAAKDAGLIYLKFDPFLDPIRGDPRYAALLRKLGFPNPA